MSFLTKTEHGYLNSRPVEVALADLRRIVEQHLPAELVGQREPWLQLVDDVIGVLNKIDQVINRASTLARIADLGRQIEELQKGLAP